MPGDWFPMRRGDVIAVAIGLAILALAAICFIYIPNWARTNAGFGPEWECTSVGKGDPVCIKRQPAMPAPAPR
jgi:hypothetical protein